MRIILTFIFLISLVTGDLYCQTRTITGRIISEDLEEIPLVSIQQIDTTLIEKTDINGRFTIEIPSDTDSLLLTFIGFEWTTIQIQAECDTLEVVMMYDVIYDFMTSRKIERLRMKRFNKLPDLHLRAFEIGLFTTQSACYTQEYSTYFDNQAKMSLTDLLNRVIVRSLTTISPRLSNSIMQDRKATRYYEIERNQSCYCDSAKKYKHCHLLTNDKKSKKAEFLIDPIGIRKIKLLKGSNYNIKVHNTFSETEIGVAVGNPNR